MKRGKGNLVIISKKECEELQKKGFKFPNDLHKTLGKGKNKTYYATESYKLMQELNKMRSYE